MSKDYNKCASKQPCNPPSDDSEVGFKVRCESKCENDCCIKKCPCYSPEELECLYKDAVVEIHSEFILLGTGSTGATGGTSLRANGRTDVILEGNGFFIKGHYIVAPAQLVLMPPSLTSIVNRFPLLDPNNVALGSIKDQMIRASRILVSVFNVNGKGHSFVYEAELVGVDGAGDIAVLRINYKKQWNLCNPCVEKCHPYFNFGSSRGSKDGEKVYLIGDYVSNAMDRRLFNAVGAIADGLLSDHRYLDYSGFALPEFVLISAPAYAFSAGLPIINCQGQVIGMQTTDLAVVLPRLTTVNSIVTVSSSTGATAGFTGSGAPVALTAIGAEVGVTGTIPAFILTSTGAGFTATAAGVGITGTIPAFLLTSTGTGVSFSGTGTSIGTATFPPGTTAPVVITLPIGATAGTGAASLGGLTASVVDIDIVTGLTSALTVTGTIGPLDFTGTTSPLAITGTTSPLAVTGTIGPLGFTGTTSPLAVTGTTSPLAVTGTVSLAGLTGLTGLFPGQFLNQAEGLGLVAGPSEFFMRRVVKALIKGTCSRKFNCQLDTVCDPAGAFYRYKKAYAGIAYDVFTGVMYDITTDFSGAPDAFSGFPRVRLSQTGEFLSSPSCKELIGIRVLSLAGLNPNGVTGLFYVPGGTAAAPPLPAFLPLSPFLGKLQPGDVITHINCVPIGDLNKQVAPSLITWRLCAGDQLEVSYRRGGNAANASDNSFTENYDNLYSHTACLAEFPLLMDYPWYAVDRFPLLISRGFIFPAGQITNPQVPALINGSLFHPAF